MNRHPFAPGAIERHTHSSASTAQRRALKRWLLIAAAATIAASLIAKALAP